MTRRPVKFVFLGGQHAGKTSILRRYFHGNFYGDTHPSPTVGADIYSTIISTSTSTSALALTISSEIHSKTIPISIQVWDTPGRIESFRNPDGKARYTASFSDKFLKKLDAAVLVYDVSSSTSFTHVLNWYYELIERIKRMKMNHDQTRNLPIVIVGNKIDIFEERDTQKKLRKKEVVQQRDVLGLTGNWTGRDYRYEYSASPPSTSKSSSSFVNTSSSSSRPQQLELLTYYLGTNTNYLEAILNNEVYRGSYLDSLISSEDKSHPDKDMVQLWCMRNGLIHMDVSAKSGAGIDKLIHQLVDIALKQIGDSATKSRKNNDNTDILQRRTNTLQRNDELDLHQRYSPKSTSCHPFQCCCK
mmetsp:Transcript_25460/g.25825  ORF Transcript_25460/g.25825 Transcript_25460/m.25825 type:complete len:359 (-) Transcript_25460:148-1224(-)